MSSFGAPRVLEEGHQFSKEDAAAAEDMNFAAPGLLPKRRANQRS
jgi:hypothetical protein